MKHRISVFVGLFAMLLLAGIPLLSNTQVRADGDTSCTLHNFVAAVRVGPDANWSVTGDLNLMIAADGAISGTVTSADDANTIYANVIGQLTGKGLNLAFDLGKPANPDDGVDNFYLFGNGTMVNAPADCAGPMGGVFAGPRPGDLGDWDICQTRPGTLPPIPCIPIVGTSRAPADPPIFPTLAPIGKN